LARSRRDDREGGNAVLLRHDSASAAPTLDERRIRTVDRALDHFAGNAAGVNVSAVADVDADVADRAFLGLSEREQVTWEEAAGVLRDGKSLFCLLLRGSRQVEVERGHDVLAQAAAVEALLRRLPPGSVAPSQLSLRELHRRIPK